MVPTAEETMGGHAGDYVMRSASCARHWILFGGPSEVWSGGVDTAGIGIEVDADR